MTIQFFILLAGILIHVTLAILWVNATRRNVCKAREFYEKDLEITTKLIWQLIDEKIARYREISKAGLTLDSARAVDDRIDELEFARSALGDEHD